MEAGTDESSFVATATASCVMAAPCFPRLPPSSTALPVLLGWTANTNSIVALTPSCRNGRCVRLLISGSLSHGGSTLGLIKAFRACIKIHVCVLTVCQVCFLQVNHFAILGSLTYLSTSSLYSCNPCCRASAAADGSNAFFAASTISCVIFGCDCCVFTESAMATRCSVDAKSPSSEKKKIYRLLQRLRVPEPNTPNTSSLTNIR